MIKKIIPTALIIIGLLVLAYPTISEHYDNYMQKKLMEDWQENLVTIDNEVEEIDTPVDTQEDTSNETAELLEKEEQKRIKEEYVKKHTEGILKIEKIKLNLPILTGATKQNMNISVSSMENAGVAGKIGNYVIAGHRNRTYGRNFNRLDEVELGDIIEVDTAENQYEYTVSEKLYVKPEEVWVLKKNKKEKEITLITCHPMTEPTHRLIIKGKIIE